MGLTPHNEAKIGDIAKTVIMPGDPLRAKLISETYLKNSRLVNGVRNMLAYTGEYEGEKITVMGSGMGVASMGIYSYELFKFYEVDKIIRIGTMGGISDELNIGDIVLAQAASTNSNYAAQYKLNGTVSAIGSFNLLHSAKIYMDTNNIKCSVGNVLTSDTFYSADDTELTSWDKLGVLGVEMETLALYLNAMYLKKQALSMFTVSDIPSKNIAMSANERLNSLHKMIKVALNVAKESK